MPLPRVIRKPAKVMRGLIKRMVGHQPSLKIIPHSNDQQEFIKKMCYLLLGRRPDQNFLAHHTPENFPTPESLVASLLNSPEFGKIFENTNLEVDAGCQDKDLVKRLYQLLLNRPASEQDILDHQDISGDLNKLIWRLISSPEFERRLKNFNHEHSLANTEADQKTTSGIVKNAYRYILRREPDEDGLKRAIGQLEKGSETLTTLLDQLVASSEFTRNVQYKTLPSSLHFSRMMFVRALPRASRILDLGGGSRDCEAGGLVETGYPYDFDLLTVVDLPESERHEIYKSVSNQSSVQTPRGPVNYLFRSMADLSDFADESVDLVFSGQSIEHIHRDEAVTVLSEALRVLKPGGFFCLDTPNGDITRIQQEGFIDPDHKIEYSHQDLSQMIEEAGFTIKFAKGLNYAGPSAKSGTFDGEAIAKATGLYDDIHHCYLLAYMCQKPDLSEILLMPSSVTAAQSDLGNEGLHSRQN